MANSFVTYTGNGSQQDFTVTFPYIKQADVSVTVNGSTASFTWTSSTLVHLSSAPANGSTVRISRTTELASKVVDFTNGARFPEEDLDSAVNQLLYLVQEIIDGRTS